MSGGPGGGSKNLQSVPATGLGGAGHAVIFAILSMMMQKKRVAPLFLDDAADVANNRDL